MSTGQIVGGVVGTVVGFFAGYPMLGAQLGMLAGGALDPGKGPNTSGPRLADLTVQTSTYGAVIPRLYGTQAFTGNVFWLEGNAIKETPVKKKTGGKGGKPKSTQTTWVNTATFAVGLCKGPIAGIRRIWIKGELFYDAGSADPSTIAASNAAAEGFEVYLGTNTQMPDPRIQADLGAVNTPAWRGLAYIVFYDLNLAKYGETLLGAQVKVEVIKTGNIDEYDSNTIVTSDEYLHGLKWDGYRFYGIGYWGGKVIHAPDGETWTTADLGAGGWTDVMFNGDVYLATREVSPARCARSHDLISWTVFVPPEASWVEWRSVTLGPSKQMLMLGYDNIGGMSQGYWATTTDALTFSSGGLGFPISRQVSCVHNGSVYCMAYRQSVGPVGYFAYSSTGATWTQVVAPSPIQWPHAICANGTTLLSIGGDTSGNYYATVSNDNGVSWSTPVALPYGPYRVWENVSHNGSYYCSISGGGNEWLSSVDGVTWALHTLSMSLLYNWPAWNGSTWATVTDNVLGYEAISRCVLFGNSVVVSANPTLDDVVESEVLLSGIITAGDIHTSLLTSEVRGYLIASQGSIRSALEPLRASWPFDIVQHGYQLKFIPRGGSSVATIDADDLDAHNVSGKPGVQITTSREMDSQLPRVLTIKHSDYAREYEVGEQYAERLVTDAITDETIDLPIVLTSAEAAGKAETLLYLRWLERFDISFTIPATYNNLEPADVVTLQTPEGNVSVRLTSINYTSDGRLECKGKYNSSAVYVPASVGSTPIVTGASTLPSVGPSSYVMLDVPYMHTAQADPSFLVSMWGADGWPGGVLMRTDDSGTTWNEVQAFTSPGGTSGIAADTLGSVDSRVWDKGSRLSVTLQAGDVFDATELAVLNGSNHFAYGAHGRWEIIAVQKCTLVSGSTYTFSDMLRGRFGTEWAMTTHVAGDRVVALTSSEVTTIGMSAATIGLARTYRGVTYDQDISTASDYAFTYNGVNLECLSPVYFSGYNAVGSTDWTLTWIRRSRTDGEWRDLVDVGLGETTEAYEVDIFADGTYTTVKRTLTATSPTCTYTTADQTTDFGSAQTTIYAKVYQMSSVVGRGYPTTCSLVTAGNDPYFGSVVLLLSMQGLNNGVLFPDIKGHSASVNGNAKTVTSNYPIGLGSSASFDGVGDRVSYSGADLALGTGDCTIEFWLYPVTGGGGDGYGRLLQIGSDAASGGLYITRNASEIPMAFLVTWYTAGAYVQVVDYTPSYVADNTWHYFQLVRASGVWSLYVNGSLYATKTPATVTLTGTVVYIGSNNTATLSYNGGIGPVRVTKAARTDHSVPTAQFPTY